MKAPPPAKLALTHRAAADIEDILEYSAHQWGQAKADEYLDQLEAALERLKLQPSLAQVIVDLHPALKFYRVAKHCLVCDVQTDSIVVLTITHASMDIPSRLAELQPTLSTEVELLHRHLRQTTR